MPKSVLFEERIPENILELQCATEVAEIILENDTCRYWITYRIRIYSEIYSGCSAPGSRIAGMEIQVFRNENSSQTKAFLHYSNYSFSGLIPNERDLSLFASSLNSLIPPAPQFNVV